MYEHHKNPLLPVGQFLIRVFRSLGIALALVGVSLGMGVVGYHVFEGLPWIDAFLNAAMILSGMGPVSTPMQHLGGKVFAGCYALFSGLAFIGIIGIAVAPVIHRFLHKFHQQDRN
jgi:hypothetical protein